MLRVGMDVMMSTNKALNIQPQATWPFDTLTTLLLRRSCSCASLALTLTPRPLFPAHLDPLRDILQTVECGTNIKHKDRVAIFVRRARIVINDITRRRFLPCLAAEDSPVRSGRRARDDPVVAVEWRFGARLPRSATAPSTRFWGSRLLQYCGSSACAVERQDRSKGRLT